MLVITRKEYQIAVKSNLSGIPQYLAKAFQERCVTIVRVRDVAQDTFQDVEVCVNGNWIAKRIFLDGAA